MATRQPKILIAPGSFKECALDSADIAAAIRAGVLSVLPDASLTLFPMCDGGTGFSKRVFHYFESLSNGKVSPYRKHLEVEDAARQPVLAEYTLLEYPTRRVAVVESASVVGLAQLDDSTRRATPLLNRTSYGLGVLLRHILVNDRPDRLYIGTGDSAVNDAGVGIGQALGLVSLLDAEGNEIDTPVTPADLGRVTRVVPCENPELFLPEKVFLACNPSSILCGPEGTTRRYGPQKQALQNEALERCASVDERSEELDRLEEAITHWAKLVQQSYGVSLHYLPGAGGAGGVAAGVRLFLKANIRFSLDALRHLVPFEDSLRGKDLVITGEGAVDQNTGTGKVCYGLGLWGKKAGSEVAVLAGQVRPGAENLYARCIDDIHCIHGEPGKRPHEELLAAEVTREGLILAAQRAVTRFCNMPARGSASPDSKGNKDAPRAFFLTSPDLLFMHCADKMRETKKEIRDILKGALPSGIDPTTWYTRLVAKPVHDQKDYGRRMRRALRNLGQGGDAADQVSNRINALWDRAARAIHACSEDATEFLGACARQNVHVTVGHAHHPLARTMAKVIRRTAPAKAGMWTDLCASEPPHYLPDPRYLEWAFSEAGLSRIRTVVVGSCIADDLLPATVLRCGTALIDARFDSPAIGEAYPFCALSDSLAFLTHDLDGLFREVKRRQGVLG